MTEKTLTTDNIRPALDALRGELAPWPVVTMKQDKLNGTQKAAINSGITSGLVAQIIANTAAIRALESAITGTGLRPLVVASLPAIGTQGILYIVPVTTYDPATDADVVNYSNEYIWIVAPDAPVTQGYYEQVGQTGIVINDGTLTVKANNVSLGTFTANQSGNTDINITIPTNSDYVDLTTDQTAAGVKTFSDGIVGNVTGTASRAIADADGNTISSTYGKLAGANTWSNENIYTNVVLTLKQTNLEEGELPTSNQTKRYRFTDKNNASLGWVQHRVNTSGDSALECLVVNKFYNGQLSTQGSEILNSLSIGLHSDGSRFLTVLGDVYPDLPNRVCNLGTSTNRWSSVYADSYYYGTTAWGLDKANVWTTDNQFNGSNIVFKNGLKEVGSASSGGHYTIGFWDKNNERMGWVQHLTEYIRIGCRNKFTNNVLDPNGSWKDNYITIYVKNDGTKSTAFLSDTIPEVNNAYNLGTSTNKWKTINGINPGALSLPDVSDSVAVDTTNWVYDGLTANLIKFNNAVQTFNGWLYITAQNTSANDRIVVRYVGSDASNLTFIGGKFDSASSIFVACPIVAGVSTYVWSTKALNTIKIYKALGNV